MLGESLTFGEIGQSLRLDKKLDKALTSINCKTQLNVRLLKYLKNPARCHTHHSTRFHARPTPTLNSNTKQVESWWSNEKLWSVLNIV